MKEIIKAIIYLVFSIAIALPLYIIWRVFFFSTTSCFTTISELLSLLPGYVGYFARQTFYDLALKTGNGLHISFGTILQYPSVKFGNNVYVGQNCNIAKATIGSGVKMGSGVHIVNKATHDIEKNGDISSTNIKKLERVHIRKNSWIGNKAIIMADIGERCIIGAGAVVTKPIPDNSVAVGNPAKVIKKK